MERGAALAPFLWEDGEGRVEGTKNPQSISILIELLWLSDTLICIYNHSQLTSGIFQAQLSRDHS